MFNVWKMPVSAIAWVFAVILVGVVYGVVLPYGRSDLAREDEDNLDSQRSYLFGSAPDEEDIPLVPGYSSKTATYNV